MSLLVIDQQTPQRRALPVLRALAMTGAITAGFVTVFGAFGLLAAPAADWVSQRRPWLTVVISLLLAALGGWLLSGRELASPVPKPGRAPDLRRRFWPMYLFGMSFAVASLGCTIGPFLGVVVIGRAIRYGQPSSVPEHRYVVAPEGATFPIRCRQPSR